MLQFHSMRIGIDISQLAYENTGVANYLHHLILKMIEIDRENEYVLFFSSMRKNFELSIFPDKGPMANDKFQMRRVKIKKYKIPPTFLDILWNKLHIIPIETFIGDIDVFISSDWTQPPTRKAKKATILYDLIVYKSPEETAKKIVTVQKRKLYWVKKEADVVFCISEATKKDAMEILGIDSKRLHVIYPGLNNI